MISNLASPCDNFVVSKVLKDARIAADLTQEELAAKIGYTRATISYWECGRRVVPAYAVFKILEVCGKSIDEVLPIETAVDSKLNELLSLWGRFNRTQKVEVLKAARRQILF